MTTVQEPQLDYRLYEEDSPAAPEALFMGDETRALRPSVTRRSVRALVAGALGAVIGLSAVLGVRIAQDIGRSRGGVSVPAPRVLEAARPGATTRGVASPTRGGVVRASKRSRVAAPRADRAIARSPGAQASAVAGSASPVGGEVEFGFER